MPQPRLPAPPRFHARKMSAGAVPCLRARRPPASRAFRRVVELSLDQLAFDLEPDDEEEDRHEPVVHPVPEGLADSEAPDADREVVVPDTGVASRSRDCSPRRAARRPRQARRTIPLERLDRRRTSSPTGCDVPTGEREANVGSATSHREAPGAATSQRRPDFPALRTTVPACCPTRRRVEARRCARTPATGRVASWPACAAARARRGPRRRRAPRSSRRARDLP